MIMSGAKINVEKSVLRKSTVATALSCKAFFLNES